MQRYCFFLNCARENTLFLKIFNRDGLLHDSKTKGSDPNGSLPFEVNFGSLFEPQGLFHYCYLANLRNHRHIRRSVRIAKCVGVGILFHASRSA